MAVKQIELPGVGPVTLYKRKGNRSIRLSIAGDGSVRVTMPHWLSYQAGLNFASSKRSWILAQQKTEPSLLTDGQAMGKAHHLKLEIKPGSAAIRAYIKGTQVVVEFPASYDPGSREVQQAARAAGIRALRLEAKRLLPVRLKDLAKAHDLSCKKVTIRQLKSRWGSCNQQQEITLNLFLMQLPWQLIDYVILHELSHTKVLHHGPDFWRELESHLPDAKQLRKQIHGYKPAIN